MAFADHWNTVTGHDPDLLVMDSKVTTQDQLWALTERGIGFITLRARTPKLTAALQALPAKAWTSMTVARAGGKTRTVRVIDDPAAKLSNYPGTLRQLAVAGLGHDEPTLLITNRDALPAKQVIETYARRMNIEQRLAEAIRSFGLDPSPAPSPSTSTSTSCSPCSPTPSAPPCAGACPATPPPPPTPCNADS